MWRRTRQLDLAKAESDKLNALMQQATLLKVHPELPLDHEKHDHLRADPNAAANHARVQRLWNDLSPEAQKVYKQVRDLLSENWKARAKADRTSVERLYDRRMDYWNRELETADSPEREAEVKKRIKRLERLKKTKVDEYENRIMTMAGPYFPLMRFGDYIVVADSRRLADMRNRLDAAEGDAYNKLAKEIDALERDPAHQC